MKLDCRAVKPKDREKIKNLLKEMSKAYVPPFSAKEIKDETNQIFDKKTVYALIAISKKGEIAGYVAWEKYKKKEGYAYLANALVHPDFRRQGISIKLRKLAFKQMKKAGYSGVYYTTWHTNTPMINSSKKIGMKIVKTYLDEEFRGPGGKTILFKMDF